MTSCLNLPPKRSRDPQPFAGKASDQAYSGACTDLALLSYAPSKVGVKKTSTATVVTKGKERMVCLPEDFDVPADEIYVLRVGDAVMLLPKNQDWEHFEEEAEEQALLSDLLQSGS